METVNSGSIAAENVRIATFVFAGHAASAPEMERLPIERGDDGIAPVTIEAGGGTHVDATLAVPSASLGGADFRPVAAADARCTLFRRREGPHRRGLPHRRSLH